MSESQTTYAEDFETAADELLLRVVNSLPEGNLREGQRDMCRATARALDEGSHLVASAPTGTGKSLAYLVPAALLGETVVVATATKALQDQLIQNDIPLVADSLDRPLKAVTLKGKSNYLCLQKLADGAADSPQGTLSLKTTRTERRAQDELKIVSEWAERTDTGDLAELPFEPHAAVRSAITVDARECPGRKKCPSGPRCFAERARAAADEADIVVVNTHLYLLGTLGPSLLPEHRAVVFDEAHELEDIASGVFGTSVTRRRCFRLVDRVRAASPGDAHIDKRCMVLTDALNDAFSALEIYKDGAIPEPPPEEITNAAQRAAVALRGIASEMKSVAQEARSLIDGGELAADEVRAQLDGANIEGAAKALANDLEAVSGSARTRMATWVETERGELVWKCAPIDVSAYLQTLVWSERTAVLTSATIPINFAASWGLPEAHDFLEAPSSFDFQSNSVLYVPSHMPRPGAEGYDEALHDETEALIRCAGGRTLALFTSYRALDAAVAEMRRRLPYRILSQKDKQKPELLRIFREEPETCLFGTLGLWQGVDVPGDSCSLVIIARLPFPRPDDVLLQARRDMHGEHAFFAIDVPLASTRLAQGAGRLLRTEKDRGVVAVLDVRLAKAGYSSMLGALPPFKRTMKRENVERFLTAA